MIDFSKDYILENDRIILRPLNENDFDLLIEFSVNEPELWNFNSLDQAARNI
jgi:RimJ/RimL family protein N-acetyltransferase